MKAYLLCIGLFTFVNGSPPVCSSLKKRYTDSACCGGNGDAFCAASETLDFAALSASIASMHAKLENITSHLNSFSVAPSPPVSASNTLGKFCGISTTAEPASLGVYPPTSAANPESYAEGSSVSYEYAPGEGEGISRVHPKGFPPFFGFCQSAKDFHSNIGTICAVISPEMCEDVRVYTTIFSITLQLEYFATLSTLVQSKEFGSRWVESIFETAPLQPVLGITNSLRDEMYARTDSMLAHIKNSPFPESLKSQASLIIESTTTASWEGHYRGLRGIVMRTSQSVNNVFDMPMIELGDNRYPENFDICQASREMFDFMLQNPKERYPQLAESLDRMYRCGSGARLLQIQSEILGIEKDVTSTSSMAPSCPKPEALTALVNEFTSTFIRHSEVMRAQSVAVVPDLTFGPPTSSESYWLPGNDYSVMLALHLVFINVHIGIINDACGFDVPFRDPAGVRTTIMTVTHPEFREYFTSGFVEFWRNEAGEALFPDVPSYRTFYPNEGVPLRGFLSTTVYSIPPSNYAPVQARETIESLTKYSYKKRFEHYDTIYPERSFLPFNRTAALACAYDPVGFLETYTNSPEPLDESMARAFFPTFGDIGVGAGYVDAECKNNHFNTKCATQVCDLPTIAFNNPGISQYLPGLPYNAINISYMWAVMMPLCYEFGHVNATFYCSS